MARKVLKFVPACQAHKTVELCPLEVLTRRQWSRLYEDVPGRSVIVSSGAIVGVFDNGHEHLNLDAGHAVTLWGLFSDVIEGVHCTISFKMNFKLAAESINWTSANIFMQQKMIAVLIWELPFALFLFQIDRKLHTTARWACVVIVRYWVRLSAVTFTFSSGPKLKLWNIL